MKFGMYTDYGSALAYQIWPSLVKGAWYRSPPNVNFFPKLRIFLSLEGDTINGFKRNLACKRRLYPAKFGPDGESAHAASFAAARHCLQFLVVIIIPKYICSHP